MIEFVPHHASITDEQNGKIDSSSAGGKKYIESLVTAGGVLYRNWTNKQL